MVTTAAVLAFVWAIFLGVGAVWLIPAGRRIFGFVVLITIFLAAPTPVNLIVIVTYALASLALYLRCRSTKSGGGENPPSGSFEA